MALSNSERISKALELLTQKGRQWVGEQLAGKYGKEGIAKGQHLIEQSTRSGAYVPRGIEEWDVPSLLTVILGLWRDHFSDILGPADKNLLHEVQNLRNDWAHQRALNTNDTLRGLDTVQRLLRSISADKEASEVERLHGEVMRTRFAEMQRTAVSRAQRQATGGKPQAGLKPWREVIVPHPDVRDGVFEQAQFAADLAQVQRGEASREYGDPQEFFRRTYITAGLEDLILNTLKRLNGEGGQPVIKLQTNFGGGKTHSMLALYHLVGDVPATGLTGIEDLLRQHGLKAPPKGTRRAVLVGTAFSPGQPADSGEGFPLNTFWGRMAWQLGGKEGYELVAASDRNGTSPGSDDLVKLFKHVGPALILIDEWVAYCRNCYNTSGLAGGTFDQNLTFAQALTEAVKAVPHTQLIASLPQSNIEVGGTGGQEALSMLEHTFRRIEFNWRAAGQQESYEIVRRRLFEPMTEPTLFADRDAVIGAFANVYHRNRNEFPSEVSEGSYEERMKSAYPIHPELFDRLYRDWSSLEEFQRTRGVLRLMAIVIHSLWSRSDRSLMVLPGLMPIDEGVCSQELVRYLPDNWSVIIESDVDGPESLPAKLDKEIARFGQFWASRRVARTVYMGSAPVEGQANRGLDIRNIRLGCVQPGENIAVFGDALRQLGDSASHLYADGSRYWYSTQPNVLTLARDRAARIEEASAMGKVVELLKELAQDRLGFHRVHLAPVDSGDVPDEPETRLVILPPASTHVSGSDNSDALAQAREILERRGSGPRHHRNALFFVAADQSRMEDLREATRLCLAWEQICDQSESLNLDPFNAKMARTRFSEALATLRNRIPEVYQWLLFPEQADPAKPVEWSANRLTGGGGIVERVWKKLKRDDVLRDEMAGTILRMEMDRYLWKEQPHLKIRSLVDYFSQYLYLTRVTQPSVILGAIESGVSSSIWNPETFAYADRFDPETGRYHGLVTGRIPTSIATDDHAVLVRPEIAQKQLEAEPTPSPTPGPSPEPGPTPGDLTPGGESPSEPSPPAAKTRYFGVYSVKDATRLNKEVGTLSNEIIQHLTAILGAKVEVNIEINAEIPSGLEESTIRILRENSTTLGFGDSGVE